MYCGVRTVCFGDALGWERVALYLRFALVFFHVIPKYPLLCSFLQEYVEVVLVTSRIGTAEMNKLGLFTIWLGDGEHGVMWLCKCLILRCESSDIAWRQVRLCFVVNNTELMTIEFSVFCQVLPSVRCSNFLKG